MRNGADAVRDSMTTGDSLSGVSVAVEQLLCYHRRVVAARDRHGPRWELCRGVAYGCWEHLHRHPD